MLKDATALGARSGVDLEVVDRLVGRQQGAHDAARVPVHG